MTRNSLKSMTMAIVLTLTGIAGAAAEETENTNDRLDDYLLNRSCSIYDPDEYLKPDCEKNNSWSCVFYAREKINESFIVDDSENADEDIQKSASGNYQEASGYLKKACSGNSGAACTESGRMYKKGLGTVPDIQTASSLFKKACGLDDGEGCGELGRIYLDSGKISEAVNYFDKGCILDDPYSCFQLGNIHANGKTGRQNFEEAKKFYEKSCRWIAYGCSELAYMYAKGAGVKQDLNLAVYYYRLSPELSDKAEGLQFPLPEIKKQLEEGCSKNNAGSCVLLGRMTDDSSCFEKACSLNDGEGCDFAGSAYGIYEVQDYGIHQPVTAEKYLKKGCELNNVHACASLAMLYKLTTKLTAEDEDGNPVETPWFTSEDRYNDDRIREVYRTADKIYRKACSMDPGPVFGNFRMTADNILLNKYDDITYVHKCSKYALSDNQESLMKLCDLNYTDACRKLIDLNMELPHDKRNYYLIQKLLDKTETLAPPPC